MKHSWILLLLFFLVFGIAESPVQVKAADTIDPFDRTALDETWSWNANPAITYSLAEERGFLTVDVPGDRPYNIWSNDVHDGVLLLRHDQGSADWIIETRLNVRSSGEGFQTGLVVWSNPYVMFFGAVQRDRDKKKLRLVGESLGISELGGRGKKAIYVDEPVELRIVKIGKSLQLQYWDDQDESFTTVKTYVYKFPVNGVGLMVRTFGDNGSAVKVSFDYFKLIR